MKRIFWLLPLTILWLASCVPNRKVVFLQKDDVNQENVPKDSVLRTYQVDIKEYTIQPLDLLSIRIESLTEPEFDFMEKLYPTGGSGGGQNSQLLNSFLLDPKGEVEFPVVGKIKLSGMSVFNAQEKLQRIFGQYLQDPVARIRLLNFRFTVLGEVSSEKQVSSTNPRVTLMEAIGLAGGLSDLADRKNVKIIRQNGSESQVLYMDLLDENLLTSRHYYVQQNDIIIVPPLRQRPFRKYWSQNLAVFVSTVSVILLVINLTK